MLQRFSVEDLSQKPNLNANKSNFAFRAFFPSKHGNQQEFLTTED
jgi:hypothetical protein